MDIIPEKVDGFISSGDIQSLDEIKNWLTIDL